MWDKFTTGYQHLWANTYGEIGGDEYHNWAKALNCIDPQKVMAGIARAIKECTDYPPNLIKFLRFCREEKVAYHQAAKFLPPPVKEDPNEESIILSVPGAREGSPPILEIQVKLISIDKNQAYIGIQAPGRVKILRAELRKNV